MLTRRACLQAAVAPLLSRAVGKADQDDDLTRHVNLTIGTGGHGHTFPGACVPFGAVQLSPDTNTHGWDWCSGYHDTNRSLLGFSHTHLSGTGIGDLLDVLVVPRTGPVRLQPGRPEDPNSGYRSRFSHSDEQARPGYYSVRLRDAGIFAELSATERVGIHRYTFPRSESAHFVIDLAHGYAGRDQAPTRIASADLRVLDGQTLGGGRRVEEWAKGRHLYFAMRFSRPFRQVTLYSNDQAAGEAKQVHGTALKAVVQYGTADGEAVLIKTGISGVSVEGALKNLDAEVPDFDFASVTRKAQAAWQEQLSKIRISTENATWKTIFYSSLYHTMVAPTLFDDVDGRYRGMDGQVHQLPRGAHNYSTFSLWDTYRALHPLYTLMHPERVPDLVNCLIRMGQESPEGAPVWPLQGVETNCMSGYHSAPVIAEAIVKGLPGIDVQGAWAVLSKRANRDDFRGLNLYRKLGFIPSDQIEEAASRTLEYAYDDWAVAAVAQAAGKADDAAKLKARSYNYRNLFDKQGQFMRPRLANGAWAEPFDPKALGHSKRWNDFTECNAWQATFLVQHDVPAYVRWFGGKAAYVKKLDDLFEQSSTLPPGSPPDIAGLVGQYAHGNEPSHHIAYLYVFGGAAYKTQERVRFLLEKWYQDAPDGIAGNEDCGQMSAWYVLSALGFYPVDPVSGNYVLGSPLFESATLRLGGGRELRLSVKRRGTEDVYIQSVAMNGKTQDRAWFSHRSILGGGEMQFEMGTQPNKRFGTDSESMPV